MSKLDIESCFICFYFSFDLCLAKLILQKKNVGLWYTDVLKPLLVLVIKTFKKGMEL